MSEAVATATDGASHTEYTIIVNGQQQVVPGPRVTYDEVVKIAYPTPPGPDPTYTVTYRNARAPRPEGSLVEGQQVEVKKEGTVFNVTATNKS